MYVEILERTLLPFKGECMPDKHRLMQNNDPKHCSKVMHQKILYGKGVNRWKTPRVSRLQPIENLWHELKEFIKQEVKLKSKHKLVTGIQQLWGQVDGNICEKYIMHLRKVIPSNIELDARWNRILVLYSHKFLC